MDEKDVRSDGATCPWCSAPNPPDATVCAACGAALAQRDSLGDVAIPGLTSVDPGLAAYAERPMRLRGPSPSHGMAGGAAMAAALGGPAGLAALGGLGLVAAAEYLGAAGSAAASVDAATVGELTGLERIALEAARGGDGDPGARGEIGASAMPGAGGESGASAKPGVSDETAGRDDAEAPSSTADPI